MSCRCEQALAVGRGVASFRDQTQFFLGGEMFCLENLNPHSFPNRANLPRTYTQYSYRTIQDIINRMTRHNEGEWCSKLLEP